MCKFTDTGSRTEVPGTEGGVTLSGYRVSVWDDEDVGNRQW